MSTRGGNPWRVVDATGYRLSSDGRWILYLEDGQVHRAPVNSGVETEADERTRLFTAYGENAAAVWSPDDSRDHQSASGKKYF